MTEPGIRRSTKSSAPSASSRSPICSRSSSPAPGMRIVDLGCGTGRLTRSCTTRLKAHETIGIDRSARMLESGARRRSRSAWACRSRSATSTPSRPIGEYDLVFSNAALHWVEDHGAHPAPRRVAQPEVSSSSRSRRRTTTRHTPAADELTVSSRSPRVRRAGTGHNRCCRRKRYARLLYRSGFAEQHVRLVIYPHVLDINAKR